MLKNVSNCSKQSWWGAGVGGVGPRSCSVHQEVIEDCTLDETRSHSRAVGGWMWLRFNRTIPADFWELRELAGVDFPQELGLCGRGSPAWSSGPLPRSNTWRLSQHSNVCGSSTHFRAGSLHDSCSKKQLKRVGVTSAYSVSSKQSYTARAVAIFWLMLTLFCDKLYA